MSLLKDCLYKISVKKNVLEMLLLSDGSTGNGVFDNMQYAVNQLQKKVAFLSYFRVKGSLTLKAQPIICSRRQFEILPLFQK